MSYSSTEECINDLEKNGHLLRITEEVDPNLEMAAIHCRVYDMQGPALFFENVKGSKFRAVSNLFGTLERSKFIFRDSIKKVETLVEAKRNPMAIIKNPLSAVGAGVAALSALPLKSILSKPVNYGRATISELPLIKNWPMDGGAFVTLPIVYTEDADKPGIMNSNLGMYRIQLNGNEYDLNKEIGLHYQLHRGIGVHQTKWNKLGKPMKVSIFVGGPPAHAVAAVMPLPEGLSEVVFGGVLANRNFRYFYDRDGFCISSDADFVITGYAFPNDNKPEGPFGDHLGYYSLKHDFPLLKVKNVYHRKNAIWPFTVVGRPPQEDTSFGALIHEITGPVLPSEIPGLKQVNAVDAAGVHPLLFAIGNERYTPYKKNPRPSELLTIANHILGKGQLSLAKFLFIASESDNIKLNTHPEEEFLVHILERINLERDVHFYTNTSIDTLDYSGDGLNTGSKVVFAAVGEPIRTLGKTLPTIEISSEFLLNLKVALPGVLIVETKQFESYYTTKIEIEKIKEILKEALKDELKEFPLIVIADDANFVSATLNNFLWVTFTRSNPSHDIYGIDEKIEYKHWSCKNLVIDARIKPQHAPELIKDTKTEKIVDRLFDKGGSLYKMKSNN
jgi:4-hydroxy-3-polyprenylbenzoate decarboxylase